MTDGAIFLLGMQRGGTNQLLNALRSHPDTTWPDGEFHEVLRPRHPRSLRDVRMLMDYLPLALRKGDILSPRKVPVPLTQAEAKRISRSLERAIRQNTAEVRRYKAALAESGLAPLPNGNKGRLVVKLMNYNIGLAEHLQQAFPGLSCVGIMRDPFGICESMMARGDSLEKVLKLYTYVGENLLRLEADGFPITVIRLEDLIADFRSAITDVYARLNLDMSQVTGICLQSKERILDDNGEILGTKKVDHFHSFETVNSHMRGDVNAKALEKLTDTQIATIAARCAPIMDRFGYQAP